MIALGKIIKEYKQTGNTCVLSSYAIVSNYYTGIPIADFFNGYCKHYGLPFCNLNEAILKHDIDFNERHRVSHCEGYRIILHLHNNSEEIIYKISRNILNAEFISDVNPGLLDIGRLLQYAEALLNVTIKFRDGNYHSVTVGAVGDPTNPFVCIDTGVPQCFTMPSINEICKRFPNVESLKDGLLFTKRVL